VVSERAGADRRNYLANLVEGGLYLGATPFFSPQTVLPALVAGLGGGNLAVGTVAALTHSAVFFPQAFVARHVAALPWKKPWALALGAAQRSMVLLLALAVLAFGAARPELTLALVLLLFAANQLVLGAASLVWFDLFAKATPVAWRGRLVGWRNALGGALSVLSGAALTWLLATFAFPRGFALALLAAFALQLASLLVQLRYVEPDPSPTPASRALLAHLRDLRGRLRRHRGFASFIAFAAGSYLAMMPVGFFAVYAIERFGASATAIGGFTLMLVTVQIVSAPLCGVLADRLGNKAVLAVTTAGLLGASAWALLAPTLAAFTFVFAFVGVHLGSEVMARHNMAAEYAPEERRALFVGAMNTTLAPFCLSGLIGGVIADAFGYRAVFAAGLALAAAALAVLLLLVRDPRHAGRRRPSADRSAQL
jgi:predicted MFS family arabinose efflux permease